LIAAAEKGKRKFAKTSFFDGLNATIGKLRASLTGGGNPHESRSMDVLWHIFKKWKEEFHARTKKKHFARHALQDGRSWPSSSMRTEMFNPSAYCDINKGAR
jgi:hypothetical protein